MQKYESKKSEQSERAVIHLLLAELGKTYDRLDQRCQELEQEIQEIDENGPRSVQNWTDINGI